MIDYSGTMNALGFNEVVYMCHPPDQTDAQDHRGSLDRHSHHVAALTYSMNKLLQIAYDISFPPIGIYRAVLSLNITILKVWFPILK